MTRPSMAVSLIASALAVSMAVPLAAGLSAKPPSVVSRSTPPAATPTPPAPVASLDRVARARATYEALMRGEVSVSDLAPQDMQDIIDLDRALRGELPDNRTPTQACVEDEVRRAGGKPTPLAWRVIDLKCREPGTGLSH